MKVLIIFILVLNNAQNNLIKLIYITPAMIKPTSTINKVLEIDKLGLAKHVPAAAVRHKDQDNLVRLVKIFYLEKI